MKKFALLAMAALLLLGMASGSAMQGGSQRAFAETAVEPMTEETTIPTPEEPEWETGLARAAQAEALRKIFAQGTQVQVRGQYLDYYVIECEEEDLLVEKRFVRLDSEENSEQEIRYAKNGALVFDNVYLRGEPIASLTTNTELTILEGKDDWYQIAWAEGEGYMKAEQANQIRYTGGSKKKSNGSGSGSGSSGGHSSKDGTDVDIGLLSAKDEDMTLTLLGVYYGPEQEADFTGGEGRILAEDVEGYLLLWDRGNMLKVTQWDENSCTIWFQDALYVNLPRYLVALEADENYETWTGYARSQAVVYQEYQMRNESRKLKLNQEVTVLDELAEKSYSYFYPGCYVVEVDGEIGYMSADDVQSTRFATSKKGGSSGGSGSGSSCGSSSGDTWTPPAL